MKEEMIKAPLDETNVSPTTIIDELTDGENVSEGHRVLGFIKNCPVMFTYRSNFMRVSCISSSDIFKCRKTIEDYIKQMCENTKGLVALPHYYIDGVITLTFYWKINNNEL